jgi:hypothetical protein
MDHVGAKAVLQTYDDMGHGVTKAHLLRLGIESTTPLRPADPAALLRTVIAGLQVRDEVAKRLAKNNVEPGPYFRRLLQTSQTIVSAVRGLGEGRNPRTLAAGSVYLASREVGPRVITQREVAETLEVAEYTVREFVDYVRRELCFGPLNGGSR